MMTVGFIGLGIMGNGMAGNLLKHDVPLIVHNRTPGKAELLLDDGAEWAARPRDVATAEVLFTMLAHPEAVRATALGADGFLDHMKPGALWVDCSTVHPRFSREMAQAAAQRNINFVDAPVTGTKPQAIEAQLVFFVGGRDEDIAVCRPYFDMMGRHVVHVGGHGMGTSLKVVINSLLAAAMATFAESAALGQALGLSEEILFNTLIGGPVTAPFLAMKREKMVTDDYDVQFPLQWMHKDVLMTAEAAKDVEFEMPLSAAVRSAYHAAIQDSLGSLDFSAIYRYYNTVRQP
jgi:3-hydroxyisobutyrate dehydrogenase/glyoxylate/succinic semialdehyde reductase